MKKIFSLFAASCFSLMLFSAEPVTSVQFLGTTGSQIDCGYNDAYSVLTDFTLEAWVKFTTFDGGYVLCNESAEPSANGYVLRATGGQMQLSIGNGSWQGVNATSGVVADTWYHVAATCTSSEMKIYINGVLENTTAISASVLASTQPLVIGEGTQWTDRRLRGFMADVRLWNVARTQEEIAANMSASSLTGTETGLVANWKMNEGEGLAVADATGTYPLTITDAVTWTGEVNGLQKNSAAKVDVLVNGRALSIVNNTGSRLNFSIFSLAGIKVLDGSVKASATFKLSTNLNGVYILKGIAENGSTIIKKVILN